MPDQEYHLRPDADSVEWFGAQITIVDPAGVLAAARTGPVELLDSASFPAPVRRVRFAVRSDDRDGQRVHLIEADVRTGTGGTADGATNWFVVGAAGPVGVLLARRLAAVDPTAGRIVAGAGRVVTEATRRLGLQAPVPPVVADGLRVADPAGIAVLDEAAGLGLQATITYDDAPDGDGRVMTLRAAVPSEAVSSAHLAAMFGLTLQAVRELAEDPPDPQALRGRRYVLGRQVGRGPAKAAQRTADVTLDQVGGLDEVVAQFREIAISFRHPEVMARWGARRPQGILMYGPPGTGKTMLARALANEIGAVFREIRTPEILDKWLGGSERNIKQIFREARRWREPTVMLFDEFDSIISYAGAGGDAASQAVNAVAGIFKQEMNTLIEENPNVIVVATTNFPQRVDASLVRSGRFDVKLAIPLPDEAGRVEIISKMIRELIVRHEVPPFRMFADDVHPRELAALSAGMTGADIGEVLRRVQLAKAMEEAVGGRPVGPINQDDLRRGIAGLRRS
ncbi:MAG TPA: AAA family ATPase [Micromonosporaceae bacterium]|nr:AAA family ATPase [Micromonosporaceae bacterium]